MLSCRVLYAFLSSASSTDSNWRLLACPSTVYVRTSLCSPPPWCIPLEILSCWPLRLWFLLLAVSSPLFDSLQLRTCLLYTRCTKGVVSNVAEARWRSNWEWLQRCVRRKDADLFTAGSELLTLVVEFPCLLSLCLSPFLVSISLISERLLVVPSIPLRFDSKARPNNFAAIEKHILHHSSIRIVVF